MTDHPQSTAHSTSCVWPRAYRALVLEMDGQLVSMCALTAYDDAEATELAKAMLDGHAVELWDGLRFIQHFPLVD